MTEEKKRDSLYNKVVRKVRENGELKVRYIVDLNEWDTSKMPDFKEGNPVHTGFNCMISTFKPNNDNPRHRIDIDPSNVELRKAIADMYSTYDKLSKKE